MPLNERTIKDFLASHYPRVVGGLTLLAGSRAAAEDAVQEALARGWERSEGGERIDALDRWVTVVALNLLRSRYRKQTTERSAWERAFMERGSGGTSADERVDLRRALASLPTRQLETTVLYCYVGFGVAEIARLLGVSDGTVKTALHRARGTLAGVLGMDDEHEGVIHAARSR